jgi:hypothetical protein
MPNSLGDDPLSALAYDFFRFLQRPQARVQAIWRYGALLRYVALPLQTASLGHTSGRAVHGAKLSAVNRTVRF